VWHTPGEHRLTLDWASRTREVLVHVSPASAPAPRPLVLCFHGGGGTAALAKHATRWSELADAEGFVDAYPEAVRKSADERPSFTRNPQLWNAGTGIGYAERERVDDVGFVGALLDMALAGGAIDERRIYAAGFSNGAAMALRAAAALSHRFAAVAAVCGHLWWFETLPTEPVPLVAIFGGRDPLNPIEGGEVMSPWRRPLVRPPVHRTTLTWAEWCGCPLEPTRHTQESGVEFRRYGEAGARACVEEYLLADLGHHWPGGNSVMNERIAGPTLPGFDATGVIWSFFHDHPRPEPNA